MNYNWVMLTLVFMSALEASSSEFVFELEQVASHVTPCRVHHRANASGNRVVWMFAGEYLNINFCIDQSRNVSIRDFMHSNDGGSDVLSVLLDGISVGEITTLERSNSGAYWDEFLGSGQIGERSELDPGQHTVTLIVARADMYGVEVDSVVVDMAAVNLTKDDVRCTASPLMRGDNSSIGASCKPWEVKADKTTARKGLRLILPHSRCKHKHFASYKRYIIYLHTQEKFRESHKPYIML